MRMIARPAKIFKKEFLTGIVRVVALSGNETQGQVLQFCLWHLTEFPEYFHISFPSVKFEGMDIETRVFGPSNG
jgi:hypothetical protein